MAEVFDFIASVNSVINEFIWVKIGLLTLLASGAYVSIRTKFFQLTHLRHWISSTVGKIFHKEKNESDSASISQFQSLCTALAATIGTGNIAGVATAIVVGGPGAIFWMWVAAFFGMMTKFAEEVLGLYFRRKNSDGEWSGGAMYYLRDGVGSFPYFKKLGTFLATAFAFFTMLAGFGIGNMSQVNKAVLNIKTVFLSGLPNPIIFGVSSISLILGILLMVVTALIIFGGLKRIAGFAEKFVPFMAIFYILGSLIVIGVHYEMIPSMLESIFRLAFGTPAIAGGITGITVQQVMTQGLKRGAFSNEAGLGSSVMAHSSSSAKEPVIQGMWGVFEVFFVTFVICTMTAFVILSSGYINLETGIALAGVDDATLVTNAFGDIFGFAGAVFIAISTFLFAFTTLVGWSQYGVKATEYVFGIKATKVYKIIYVIVIVFGAVMTSSLAWDISDTFNGLMMIPNLIGVVVLTPLLVKILKNYMDRHFKGEDIPAMLSYDKKIQKELEEETL